MQTDEDDVGGYALFREQVRRFVANEIAPFHREWEEQGIVPLSMWKEAGHNGLLCTTIPDRFGGGGGDFRHAAIVIEELARVNASGVGFPMHSDIVAPYVMRYGSEEQRRRWLPRMASGEMIGALGMTEPGTGSDVKNIRTRAVRDGDHYVVNGQKTFITNGANAGFIVLAVKTDPDAGSRGVSLLGVETTCEGFSRGSKIDKIGLHAQDTSELFFEDMRVPAANLLGEENQGFKYLMHDLAQERLIIAVRACASVESMLEATIIYAKERQAFGKTIFDFQNTRFTLAEVHSSAMMLRAFVDDCVARHVRGGLSSDVAAVAKLVSSEIQGKALDQLLQLHGGYGFTREYPIGQAWVDARIMRIYGGTSEIMKEIIARTL